MGLDGGVMKWERYRNGARSRCQPSCSSRAWNEAPPAASAWRTRSTRSRTAGSRVSTGRPAASQPTRRPVSSTSSRAAVTQKASGGRPSVVGKAASAVALETPKQRASAASLPSAASTLPPGNA